MKKLMLAVLAVVVLSLAASAGEMGKAATVKGWVTDTECAAHGVKNCNKKEHLEMGAKLALVSDGDGKVLTVSNPDKLADHMGHYVKVKGTIKQDTIEVQSVSMAKEKEKSMAKENKDKM